MRRGSPWPRTRWGVALKNSSGRAGGVHAIVEIAAARRLRFLHPRGPAPVVRHAGGPHFLAAEGRAKTGHVRRLAGRGPGNRIAEPRREIVAIDDAIPRALGEPKPVVVLLHEDAVDGVYKAHAEANDIAGSSCVRRRRTCKAENGGHLHVKSTIAPPLLPIILARHPESLVVRGICTELAMVIQSNRLSVRCRHCGYESSGWALSSTAPASFSSDPTAVERRPVTPASALVPLSDVAQQH